MSLPRAAVTRSIRRFRVSELQQSGSAAGHWRRAGRRSYASASETANKAKEGAKKGATFLKQSDLPWLAASLAVTVPGTYFILSGADFSAEDPGYPGSKWHGGDHEEEEEEGEEGEDDAGEGDEDKKEDEGDDGDEEKAESDDADGKDEEGTDGEAKEKNEGEEKEEDGGDEEKGKSDDDESDEKPEGGESKTKRPEGKNLPEQPTEDKISKKAKDGSEAKFSEETELDNGDSESKKIHKPDAKGGAKRRIESAAGKKLGEGEDDSNSTAGKSTESGTHAKQSGLSNTDTKHSTDIGNDPTKSKKAPGVPDTAKTQGTVDPSRPAR